MMTTQTKIENISSAYLENFTKSGGLLLALTHAAYALNLVIQTLGSPQTSILTIKVDKSG